MDIAFDSIDQLYYTVTRITTHYYDYQNVAEPRVLKIGTGFFYDNLSNHQRFLITNRHLVINENEDYFPNVVRIRLHTNPSDLRQNREYDIHLYKSAKRLWLEPRRVCADVVAFRLDLDELVRQQFIARFLASNNLLPTNIQLNIAEDIFIMGYPLGTYDEVHNLPIIRNGTISSAYPVHFNENPYFLVDANLQEGMSGAPVITKFKYIRPTTDDSNIFSGPSCYLLGIISSTFPVDTAQKPAELNAAYYASIIEDMTT